MIIDSHMHCGEELPFEVIAPLLKRAGIQGACLFAPVEDIYDRYDYNFTDSPYWRHKRKNANRYLLNLFHPEFKTFPYLFVWNDFDYEELSFPYKGIKWHRHEDEPVYNYSDKRCRQLIEKITELELPIVFEESTYNTVNFVNKLAPQAVVIIPHLGLLNGGFESIASSGIWEKENLYADTSLAPVYAIKEFIRRYGSHKLLFGSDFPFGQPGAELIKILNLKLPKEEEENILGRNILRLLKIST